MDIINSLLEGVISILDKFLPALGIPEEFLILLDTAISFIIGILQGASYFIPLDIFVICMSVMFLADNWALMFRIGQKVISLIRG